MDDATDQELETRIFSASFDFDGVYISPSCKDLIIRMLVVEPAVRISIQEILNHPWITHTASSSQMITAPQKLKPVIEVCHI